jgi:integrase
VMTVTARRAPGDGALFYDKARHVWVGTISTGRDPVTSLRVRRKVSAATKTECKDKLDALRAEYAKTGQVPRGDLTVEHVVRELLDNPPEAWRSPITMEVNGAHGNRIIAELGKTRAGKLTAAQVERMLRRMVAEGKSASTISRTRSILIRALRRAQRDHGLSRNVAELADMPGGASRHQSRAMTIEEVGTLLASDLTVFWRAWATTALGTGLRPGELSGLTWPDVDFAAGTLRVRQSMKSGALADLKTQQSKRTIRMPAGVVTALQALWADQLSKRLTASEAYDDRDLVFADEVGKPVHREHIRRGLARCCKAAGIAVFTPREMRHTFVSVLSDSGLSIEEIADAVGHVNSYITKTVYRHQIRDEVSAAATAWDSIGSLDRLPADD